MPVEDVLCYIRVSSDGASARRKTASRLLTQLRGGNAGRRRMRGGGPNSGEAALIEGDDFFGDFLRQRTPSPEEIVSSDEESTHRKTV